MKLLLSSNSTMPGEEYLGFPSPYIKTFLGEKPVKALFIPYAAVTFSFDEYEQKVNEAFQRGGHSVVSIHHFDNPAKAIEEAEAIVVGGGNTWQLVRMLHDQNLMMAIRRNVQSGTPYIGWSAGSNVACPTLRTTNDMPIIDPTSFNTTGLVPFQINPHYMDANPDGHAGETREQRINEFIEINPLTFVVGLREGTLLKLENEKLELIGNRSARIFIQGLDAYELNPGDDFNFLLK
ncbi:dipeptidase PepE [Mangrovibacterium diazotrophicum]|uniref:dipeptidase E n=1 Tax=Mangrovibacterium diazotrophicum TaxID=1261403 RepID=A0A419W9T3_9BACT|nr:dipeptidase PepE [Mangrovibacterium diazotrophicum]RKD92241.1 dipeptidase E [Mangrovibacterium diazotrophicum]